MGAGRYDVIMVGAREAGAATAMLLARQGVRMLAVDRVSFPCDTIPSHQLQIPGVALLHRWGLLGKLAARLFLAAVAADRQETGRSPGAFAGIVPPEQYFTLRTVVRLLGARASHQLTAATANQLFTGLRHADAARPAGARAAKAPRRG